MIISLIRSVGEQKLKQYSISKWLLDSWRQKNAIFKISSSDGKKQLLTFSKVRAWARSCLNPSFITALYLSTRSWLFLIMASAICRAFFKSSLPSTTWLTKPHLSACSALTGIAVKDASRARLGPIMRDSFWDRPHEGNIPNLRNQVHNKAFLENNWLQHL